MSNIILETTSISKIYIDGGTTVKALEDVNIKVEKGDYLAIVGPSGAGKSTLLHVLGGLDKPTRGSVLFQGEDIARMKLSTIYRLRNEHLGFVFQFYYLISELNVWENIIFPVLINKKRSKLKNLKAYAERLIEMLELKDKIYVFPHQLSGGQKQKVALARALINQPQILFCDEPIGNLDAQSAAVIKKVLRDINNNSTTIVLVTHNLDLAKEADRIIRIHNGRIED